VKSAVLIAVLNVKYSSNTPPQAGKEEAFPTCAKDANVAEKEEF